MAKGSIKTKRIIRNEGMLQKENCHELCTKGLTRVESAGTFKLGLSLLM